MEFLRSGVCVEQVLYHRDRFPNVVVAKDGSVLAFWNGVQVRRSEDAGATWSDPFLVGKGFMGGGVTVDDYSGNIFAFVEDEHPPAPLKIYRSRDHGKSWAEQPTVVIPNQQGHVPSMHMNEHGITLHRGKHAGRLIRPSRWYAGKNEKSLHSQHYTDAIYSDDSGMTWKSSEPFPLMGTGEAAMVELSDGSIYYNTRRHWAPPKENPRRRWHGWSSDGGQTWKGVKICMPLPDGDQDRDYGLMGGLVRLPIKGRDILLFSNIDSPSGRRRGTIWVSFDGGTSWPLKRLISERGFAYSSLVAGRTGTKSEGWIFLLYEGEKSSGVLARFDLRWILGGEATGDGKVPKWVLQTSSR